MVPAGIGLSLLDRYMVIASNPHLERSQFGQFLVREPVDVDPVKLERHACDRAVGLLEVDLPRRARYVSHDTRQPHLVAMVWCPDDHPRTKLCVIHYYVPSCLGPHPVVDQQPQHMIRQLLDLGAVHKLVTR